MKHIYTSDSYVEASAKLDQARVWLEGLGIDYSKTRVGKYKVLLSTLARYQLSNNLNEFIEEHSFPDWVNAIYESAELIRIYEGLNGRVDMDLSYRLRDSLKGHELFVLDKSDRSGRDFSLELSIAAKFTSCGYFIDFGDDADLKVNIRNFVVYLECKRLKSKKKIQGRIKEGLKQLHRRYVKSKIPDRSRGLLVLSIAKIINAHLGLLEAENDQELGEIAFAHNRAFINKSIPTGRKKLIKEHSVQL